MVGSNTTEQHPIIGIEMKKALRAGAVLIVADPRRLKQVLYNYLSNALKFTPEEGRVTLRARAEGAVDFRVQVEDTGIGIAASALPHIFEAYRQAHHDRGGTGLGLAIVRGVAHAHGGRVTVESQEGKGSRFTVLLPRA